MLFSKIVLLRRRGSSSCLHDPTCRLAPFSVFFAVPGIFTRGLHESGTWYTPTCSTPEPLQSFCRRLFWLAHQSCRCIHPYICTLLLVLAAFSSSLPSCDMDAAACCLWLEFRCTYHLQQCQHRLSVSLGAILKLHYLHIIHFLVKHLVGETWSCGCGCRDAAAVMKPEYQVNSCRVGVELM